MWQENPQIGGESLKSFYLHFLALKYLCCCFRVFFYGLFPVIVLSWTSAFNGRELTCPRHIHPTSSRHPPSGKSITKGTPWSVQRPGCYPDTDWICRWTRQRLRQCLPDNRWSILLFSSGYFSPDNSLLLPKFLRGHRYAYNEIEGWLQCWKRRQEETSTIVISNTSISAFLPLAT